MQSTKTQHTDKQSERNRKNKFPVTIAAAATKESATQSAEINCDANTMMVFNENYTSLNYSRAKDVNAIRSVGLWARETFFLLHVSFLCLVAGSLALTMCFYPLLKFAICLLVSAMLPFMLNTFTAANSSLLRISCGCSSKFMHNIAYCVLFSIWLFHFSIENATVQFLRVHTIDVHAVKASVWAWLMNWLLALLRRKITFDACFFPFFLLLLWVHKWNYIFYHFFRLSPFI